MKVREVETIQDLEEDWNDVLVKNLMGDDVFLTWEWQSASWKHFGEGRKLLVLVVEEESEIIAIAPLMLSKYRLPGFGFLREIEFLGLRHSDYNNFIISKKPRECLTHIVDYLEKNVGDWDWIDLKEVPEPPRGSNYSPTEFLNLSSGLKLRERICNLCPYISLPNSFEHLMKTLGKNMRQNLNKYLRRIKQSHKVELKRYDEAGFSVKEAMNLLIDLNEKRWASDGKVGSFKKNGNAFRNFHMDVSERFADRGWLGLYFLMASNKPVAVQYNFEYAQKMYYYLAGFDPRYSSYSVGNLVIMYLLEKCVQKGLREYDMMRGDEPYKMSWTQTCRRNSEIRLIRKHARSKFYDWVTWSSLVNNLAADFRLSLKKDSM